MSIEIGTKRDVAGVKCVAVSIQDFEDCEPAKCPAHVTLHKGDGSICNSTSCSGVFWTPVEDEPWTPKNGESVEARDSDDEGWHTEWTFIGLGPGGNFVCEDSEGDPVSWKEVRPDPTQDPRLTAAQAENTQLKADLDDLKIKLKEILDRIERVS